MADVIIKIPPSGGGGGAAWGEITGSLSAQTDLVDEFDNKQDALVSGTNIKTINNESLLGSGNIAAGGLTNWTESNYLYSTKYGVKFTPNSAQTNVDAVIQPKGTGGILAQQPDGTSAGGNNRGNYAVDLQVRRGSNTQVASGLYSVIAGGISNTASYENSAICGGSSNSATNDSCFVGGGALNSASANVSSVCGGYRNLASGSRTFVGGGCFNNAYLYGMGILNGVNNLADIKKRQYSQLSMQKQTTDATASEIFLDNSSARLVLPNNTSWHVEVIILAHQDAQVYACKYHRELLINRGSGAATTALESTVQTIGTDIENTNLSTCNIALTADTTNGSLKVEVTGKAATTINWQAVIKILEIEN